MTEVAEIATLLRAVWEDVGAADSVPAPNEGAWWRATGDGGAAGWCCCDDRLRSSVAVAVTPSNPSPIPIALLSASSSPLPSSSSNIDAFTGRMRTVPSGTASANGSASTSAKPAAPCVRIALTAA